MEKTIKSLLFALTFSLATVAQSQSTIFIRVYDLNGAKMSKGSIINITDSSIQLAKSDHYILVKNIGFIKTKHSLGHNMLMSTAITGGIFATIMAIGSNDKSGFLSWTLPEGIAAGLLAGVIYGPIIGGITAIFKNSTTFPINGSEKNWKEFQLYLSKNK